MAIPYAKFDQAHLTANGANAPHGQIQVWITCDAGSCTAATYTVRVVENATGTILAEGPVSCTGAAKRHDLPMLVQRPLTAVKVVLRFDCGGTVEDSPFPVLIWIANP